MNWLDILLIVLVAAALALCIFTIIRSNKKGRGCCGTCSCCKGNCPSRQNDQRPSEGKEPSSDDSQTSV